MTNNSLEEIAKQLQKIKCAAIFCHARPDGDALGSGLALLRALQNAGKKAVMCCDDSVPEKFMYFSAMREVKKILPNLEYDTFIGVDCAEAARMGTFFDKFSKFGGATINIDHHISNPKYAKYNLVSEKTATCEILTDVLSCAGFEITEEIANLLMLGLMTDSGNFTHLDVTENTFRVAGYLRARGAKVNEINYNMFLRQPKRRALLYGKVMRDMRFALDDRVAIILTTKSDLEDFGADKSLTEGFVDFPLTVDGVEVAVSMLEVKKNQYKISLRSKGKVNVNSVASVFGGGGHVLASGCMIFGEEEEVIERITFAISQNL